MNDPLIIYIEDLPVHYSYSAKGLSKAIVPTLFALKPLIKAFVILQTHQFFPPKALFDLQTYSLVTSRIVNIFYRFLRHLPSIFLIGFSFLHVFCISLLLRCFGRLNSNSSPSSIFCISGSDPHTIIRAFFLSRFLSISLDLYLVDIFDATQHESSNNLVATLLRHAISQVNNLYCITDGLCSLIKSRFGKHTVYLPLTTFDFNFTKRPSLELHSTISQLRPKKLLYLGSINHLYHSSIVDLLDFLADLSTLHSFSFEFVSSRSDLYKLFPSKNIPSWVSCVQLSDTNLHSAISVADLCFCPYSFDPLNHEMVSTSFPSKLLTYLSSSKLILLYAPPYSSAASLFIDHSLGLYASSLSELKSHIVNVLTGGISLNYSSCYKKLLASTFSAQNIFSIVSSRLPH